MTALTSNTRTINTQRYGQGGAAELARAKALKEVARRTGTGQSPVGSQPAPGSTPEAPPAAPVAGPIPGVPLDATTLLIAAAVVVVALGVAVAAFRS